MGIPNELVRAVRAHRVVPFVGAGVSAGVKRGLFPTWGQLIDRLAEKLDAEALPDGAREVRRLAGANDYLQAAEVACRELRPYLFNLVLRDTFRVRRPEGADLAIVEALWALEPTLVITTNYDDVLRWACPAEVAVEVVANDQDEELALLHDQSIAAPRLWHLHGTVDRLGTIILGGADYRRLYASEGTKRTGQYEGALFKLRQVLADRPVLYVGFSLSDPYVLQQIKDVLELTKGKGAPSYALMKKGTGGAEGLRSNFNIQVVEYEDHGAPLAALLRAVAKEALHAPAAPAPPPDPAPPPPVHVPRAALEDAYLRELRGSRRLLVLAPRRGGARSLARSLAARHFGQRVTWLSPPNVPGCTAREYFAALSGEPAVDGFLALGAWLEARARAAGGDHLIVLRHDGGPLDHLTTLGDTLRKLLDESRGGAPRFFVLVAGSAPCAWLLYNTPQSSLYSGAPVRHVPAFDEGEVRAALDSAGLDGAGYAGEVHRATGGHPGLVEEAILGRGALDFGSLTERLARSPAVRGVLRARLLDDDRQQRAPRLHARSVLAALRDGKGVRALDGVEDDLQYPEVRLYYDGLVVAGEGGATGFRCEAVHKAAEAALAAEEGP